MRVSAWAMFSASGCKTDFWMLSNMRRPSSMALRIETKLSSVRTMSDASFATSEPASPMAIPASARLREGESFTPSPVIAAKQDRRYSASIMRNFVVGEQRAITNGSRARLSISPSESLSSCEAVMTIASVTSFAVCQMIRLD